MPYYFDFMHQNLARYQLMQLFEEVKPYGFNTLERCFERDKKINK